MNAGLYLVVENMGRFYLKHPEFHGTDVIIVSRNDNSLTRSSYFRRMSEASVLGKGMKWCVE